jgi:hypothetical protein
MERKKLLLGILSALLLLGALTVVVVTTNRHSPGPPMTTKGFGCVSGVCAVCKTKSANLLSTSYNGNTALVCGKACGDKFRADPTGTGAPQAFGSAAGKCSVCGRTSTGLLQLSTEGRKAGVCGQKCGDTFRAAPANYGTAAQ